ncbi:CRTAC1 family protein [Dinoroseobacter sp. S76]|uniref:CRTAC1 family protein n=1 Tax=Dinoroseobacter sp. S76 TaxID=3415124 RepID=UPI003C7B042F
MRLGFLACAFLLPSAVTAQVAFEDHSTALPPHVYSGGWEHFVGGGVAVFDCNRDGLPEIFAAGGTAPAQLFLNRGGMAFEPGDLPEMTGVTGAYALDIDADGWRDLFVLRVGPNRVLRGGPDCAFTEATEDFGIDPGNAWSTAFTAWWSEGDARPTLFVGNYVDRSDPEGPFEACDTHQILIPRAEDGYDSAPFGPGYCTLSALAARDARGRMTLRLSNDRHYYVRGGYEQMFDLTENRFLGAEDGWPQVSLWGMGIASRDLNGDGRDEVMLTSMGDQLLQIAQEDGTYAAAPFAQGTYAQRPHLGDDGRPSTGWHAEFGDVDNDGRADLFLAKGNVDQMPGNAMKDPNNLLMQQSDGRFTEVSIAAGVATTARSRGAAMADLDGDGRLDLVVVNRRAPMELYRNVTPETGNWLAIDPRDRASVFAVGAEVTVITDGARQVQQRVVGGGHAGGGALPLHFGLGEARDAKIEIRDASGVLRVSRKVAANQTLRIDLSPSQ